MNLCEDVFYIWDAAVLPLWRGTSAAPRLFTGLLDVARELGVALEASAREATSYAIFNNDWAARWMSRRGFRQTYHQRESADSVLVRFEPENA